MLERHQLPAGEPSAAILDLIDAVESARRALAAAEQAKEEHARIAERWKRLLERYRPILHAADLDDGLEAAAPVEVIQRIEIARAGIVAAHKRVAERESLERDLARADELAGAASQRLEQQEGRLAELLDACGAEDEDQFRRWARDAERLRELQRGMEASMAILRAAAGGGEPEAVAAHFAGLQWEQEAEREREIGEQLAVLEEERANLDRELGVREKQRDDWERSGELALARQAESSLVARIEVAAQRWLEQAVAVRLLELARDRYERERQPEVLRRASAFFSTLTGGAYQGVQVRLGEGELYAIRADGGLRPPLHLSRGTVEPLYLALRLALVAEYADGPQGAPTTLMDDVLVNFDDRRAAAAAHAIAELAQRTQIMLLTCHERTLAAFEDGGERVTVHRLGG